MAKKDKKQEYNLRPVETLFCFLYSSAGDYFNNATRAYGMAYGMDLPPIRKPVCDWTKKEKSTYNLAGVEAHNLLKNYKIRQECDRVLMSEFKDEIADKELLWTLKQREDLNAKMSSIREYNKLKQRVTDAPSSPQYVIIPIYGNKSKENGIQGYNSNKKDIQSDKKD